jgi:hypothetical protein
MATHPMSAGRFQRGQRRTTLVTPAPSNTASPRATRGTARGRLRIDSPTSESRKRLTSRGQGQSGPSSQG